MVDAAAFDSVRSRFFFPVRLVAEGSTATAAELNELYTELKNNSDGTTGRIDTTNTRAGAVTKQHLGENAVHSAFSRISTGSTTKASRSHPAARCQLLRALFSLGSRVARRRLEFCRPRSSAAGRGRRSGKSQLVQRAL